jgi:hypothetical protein
MELLGTRDRKTRLKPGITFTRLFISLVVVAVLAVIAKHFVEGSFPPFGNCGSKEIDRGAHKEGTCTEGNSTLVVVDRHSVLKLESLRARLLGIQKRKTITGPTGSKTTKGVFLTFEVAVTNRTDAPATVAGGQFMLLLGEIHSEAAEAERYERRSFLGREQEIPPQGTEDGTVTFAVGPAGAKALHKTGNLDVVNLGSSVSPYEPEALYGEREYGVIRTYQ